MRTSIISLKGKLISAVATVLIYHTAPAAADFTCKVQCTTAAGAAAGKKSTSSVAQPQLCEAFIKKEAKKCPGGNANGDAGGYGTIKIRDGKVAR